ncbi:MAG: NUMOD3 domain-containing DNA-binding protein [Promethearchaeia archaeon]
MDLHGEEKAKKMKIHLSKFHKNKPLSQETKNKISKANKGNKKIIEFFGDYWHSKTVERDKNRINTYKKANYEVLIIREREMIDINKVINKIIKFSK